MAQIEGRFHVNSPGTAVDLARRGLGIANVLSFALRSALDRGEPVRLFESHIGESGDVAAVYLEGRTLIDFAVGDFGNAGAYQPP